MAILARKKTKIDNKHMYIIWESVKPNLVKDAASSTARWNESFCSSLCINNSNLLQLCYRPSYWILLSIFVEEAGKNLASFTVGDK